MADRRSVTLPSGASGGSRGKIARSREKPESLVGRNWVIRWLTRGEESRIQLGTALNLLESDAASNLVEHPFLTDV
jgi:hypothetical protein